MENNGLKFTKTRFFIILILLLIGIGLCVELSMIFYKTNFLDTYAASFCSVSELIDCDGVAKTNYSLSFGVPNALWGLFVYIIMLFLLFVDRIQAKFKNTIFDVFKNPRSYIVTLGLLTFSLSMILAFISIFKIHKICALCFCTYFIDLFVALAAKHKGFFIEDIKTTIMDFIDGAKKYFVLFIIVLVAFVSALVYFDKSVVFSPKLKKEKAMKEFIDAKVNKYAVKGNILGKKDGLVKIRIYSDYNCPFCRVLNIMVHKAVKNKDVTVEEVNFPLDTTCNFRVARTLGGHEASCVYAKYALAAKKQGKFWGASNVLFDKHPKNYDEMIEEFDRAKLNLDVQQLNSDANSSEILNELNEDINYTANRGIDGTPAIEINDVLYMGVLQYDELVEKIDLAIKRAKNEG